MIKATTFIATSSNALLRSLAARTCNSARNNALFCISANSDNLVPLISRLGEFGRETAGCISSPLPNLNDRVVCSLMEFPVDISSPFFSHIPGRPDVQVGRYHGMHTHRNKAVDRASKEEMERILNSGGNWSTFGSDSGRHTIPTGLDKSQEYETIFFFSDRFPEGSNTSLDYYFPRTLKIGLIGSSTPFVTGRPVTLLRNSSALSEGAVGFAVRAPFSTPLQNFEGLEPISDKLVVTESQSNLVHTLNDKNPSQLLVQAVNSSFSSASSGVPLHNLKDEDYYLAVLDSKRDSIDKIFTILSGDPKRGSLALGADSAPPVGAGIQLLRRIRSLSPYNPLERLSKLTGTITFITSSSDVPLSSPINADSEEGITLEDQFVASSENGYLLGGPQPIWHTSVECASVTSSWTQ